MIGYDACVLQTICQILGVMNWAIESEKYTNMDLVLNHYGGTAEI
jgi:hypothetical protein